MMIGASVSKVLKISDDCGAKPISSGVLCKLHNCVLPTTFPRRDFEYHMCGLFVCIKPNHTYLSPALILSLQFVVLYIRS